MLSFVSFSLHCTYEFFIFVFFCFLFFFCFYFLNQMVQRAIEVGFTHFGLSEHMPRYREEDLYKWEIKDGWSIPKLKDTFER